MRLVLRTLNASGDSAQVLEAPPGKEADAIAEAEQIIREHRARGLSAAEMVPDPRGGLMGIPVDTVTPDTTEIVFYGPYQGG